MDPDDPYDDGECPCCGGDGFIFSCFDGFCEDADIGCDDCTRPCPECTERLINEEPHMDDIRCDLCLYWDNSTALASNEDTGMCRCVPPGFDDRTGQAVWPFTEDADWCGKFAPKAKR